MKLNSFSRKMGKGWIKQKKLAPKPAKKTVQAAVVEADEDQVPGSDVESQTPISMGQPIMKQEATSF